MAPLAERECPQFDGSAQGQQKGQSTKMPEIGRDCPSGRREQELRRVEEGQGSSECQRERRRGVVLLHKENRI